MSEFLLRPPGSPLMGYNGQSYADSGYFYAPHVPLYNTPPVRFEDLTVPENRISRYDQVVNDAFITALALTEPPPMEDEEKVHWREEGF